MSSSFQRYIFKESSINFATNAFFNGIIAWLLLRDGSDLTMWGQHSFAIDLMATAFILLVIVSLIVIPLQRRKLRKGQLHPFQWQQSSALHRLLQRFPASLWGCALWIGFIGLLIFLPLTLLPMAMLGIEHFTPGAYALFKGLWAGLLAGVMMGPMIMLALGVPPAGGADVSAAGSIK